MICWPLHKPHTSFLLKVRDSEYTRGAIRIKNEVDAAITIKTAQIITSTAKLPFEIFFGSPTWPQEMQT